MSTDEITRLNEALDRLAVALHSLELGFAKWDERLSKLERSDSSQWDVIRDNQTKLMRYTFLAAGAAAALGFFGFADRIREALMK